MRTVPSGWVALALSEDPAGVAKASACQVRVGNRLEVDLDRLAAVDAGLAEDIELATQRVGKGRGVWEVLVASYTQKASGAGKSDLNDVFASLLDNPSMAAVCDVLLRGEPDRQAAAALCEALGGSLEDNGDILVAEVVLPATGLGELLGGPAWPGEQARKLQLTVRHAPWRDRQVRRLAQVNVYAQVRF